MTADPRDLHAGLPDATLVLLSELALGPSLLGLSKDRPSVVSITGESTPGVPRRRTVTTLLRRGAASSSHVPTAWSLTTSPVCSSLATRVSCNALPTLGFTTFPLVSRVRPPLRATRPCPALSRGAFLPCEAFPPCTAADPTLTRRPDGRTSPHRQSPAGAFTDPPCPLAVALAVTAGTEVLTLSTRTRPRGLAPYPDPLCASPLPARPTRCSLGLGCCPRRPPLRGASVSVFRRCATRRRPRAEGISTSKTVREERLSVRTPGCPGVAEM